MTDKAQKKMDYDERERRVVEEFAMKVFLDPASTDEDREKAKARLMKGGGKGLTTIMQAGLDLPSTVINEWLWANTVMLNNRDDKRERHRFFENPTPREKFVNAMTLAQERWAALVTADGAERAMLAAHHEWILLPGTLRVRGVPCDPIWTFCESPALTAEERLNAAMRRAQAAWEAYSDECRANGKPEPRPFYAFKPQLIVPRDPAAIDTGDVGPHPAADAADTGT